MPIRGLPSLGPVSYTKIPPTLLHVLNENKIKKREFMSILFRKIIDNFVKNLFLYFKVFLKSMLN